MNRLIKSIFLILIGGYLYSGLELLIRGRTHWTMILVGGIAFFIMGQINEIFPFEMPIVLQMFIAGSLTTIVELLAGVILNVFLQLAVWDYSNLPYNLMGQICLYFYLLWILSALPAIILDDYLRYGIYLFLTWIKIKYPHNMYIQHICNETEEKPRYYLMRWG